ncbi:uncharacterized protein LOC128735971 [Sabethes cyaneus]|uniref:uncharacterized protein LOC128735971 n=1 Tax=Sabethes cyaneus TaxID=53552 RepID=UPI00237DC442|nr:uncharacterized protein LOC128735971 [Sabethes cyaneus]
MNNLLDETDQYVNNFPSNFAFNGLLITLDFYHLYPHATKFDEKWGQLEPKILRTHPTLFKELKNDFLRALAIVRIKNPSRGSKNSINDTSRENPLYGMIEWKEITDEPSGQQSIPMIVIRGPFLCNSEECAIYWRGEPIIVENLKSGFETLIQLYTVFRIVPKPSDKHFFLFFSGAVLNIQQLSTTGTKFVQGLF